MTVNYTDIKILEAILKEHFPNQNSFSKREVLKIIGEFSKGDQYLYNIKKTPTPYKTFKYFVRYCLYRNLANFDSLILITGDKGAGKSSFALMLVREWCKLLGLPMKLNAYFAYTNKQVTERVDKLPRFSPLVCLSGKTKVMIRDNKNQVPYCEQMNKLVNRNDFEVLSYNQEKKEFEYKKPEKCVMTKKRDQIYKIELDNGKIIRATKDHLFLTKKGYKKAEDLTEQDELIIHSKKCDFCKKEFVPRGGIDRFCSIKCREDNRRTTNKYLEFQKKYRVKTKEERKIKSKVYRTNNKDKIIKRRLDYRAKNKEKLNKQSSIYHKNNREKINKTKKIWVKKNYSKVRKYHNERHKILMKTDENYRIKRNLRRRISLAIKDQNATKHKAMEKYLGCPINYFKQHIERKFQPGMNWKNYGTWHIDHIKPCSSFNLTKKSEQEKCFNYTNLQPLWGYDNLSKGAK